MSDGLLASRVLHELTAAGCVPRMNYYLPDSLHVVGRVIESSVELVTVEATVVLRIALPRVTAISAAVYEAVDEQGHQEPGMAGGIRAAVHTDQPTHSGRT